jgi:hypothetical protein
MPTSPRGTDLDLYVYQGTTLVGVSAGSTAAEEVNFTFATPAANRDRVDRSMCTASRCRVDSTPFKLHAWTLGTAAAGNMTVTPSTTNATIVARRRSAVVQRSDGGTKYLGSVAYGGPAGLPPPTIVRVDP